MASQDVFVCKFDALRPGKPVKVTVSGDQEVLVVKLRDSTIRAIGNRCPHKAASLSKGDIEDLGKGRGGLCVKCPKHQRKFGGGPLYVSLETGRCHTESRVHGSKGEKIREQWQVPTFITKVEFGNVYVQACISDGSSSSDDSDSDAQFISRTEKKSLSAMAESSADVASANWYTGVLIKKVERADSSGDTFDFHFGLAASAASRFAQAVQESSVTAQPWHVWLQLGGVEREYTPVSSLATASQGSIVMLIKLYEDGDMSQELGRLELGGKVQIGPPKTTLPRQWPSAALSASPWRSIAEGGWRLGLLCAGTGVTPCFQALALAVEAIAGFGCPRAGGLSVGLLASSRRGLLVDSALMSEELRELAGRAPQGKVSVSFTLTDNPPPASAAQPPKQRRVDAERPTLMSSPQQRVRDIGPPPAAPPAGQLFRGRVTGDMISEALPSPLISGSSSPCAVVICGPRGFAEHCEPLLLRLGYSNDHILVLDA